MYKDLHSIEYLQGLKLYVAKELRLDWADYL